MSTYKCQECDYESNRKANVERHSLKHEKTVIEANFQCTECEYSTKLKFNYNRHMKAHEGLIKKKYHCDACDKYLTDKAHLKEHYQSSEHHRNVREHFPETLVAGKIAMQRLDLSKRGEYTKVVNEDVQKTKTVKQVSNHSKKQVCYDDSSDEEVVISQDVLDERRIGALRVRLQKPTLTEEQKAKFQNELNELFVKYPQFKK